MKKILVAIIALPLTLNVAMAASALNKDKETRTIVVTEGSSRTEVPIAPGDSVEFCPSGCFVTMPNGDREALTGGETIEIIGGQAVIK
jgi:ferredoxin-like protein FixX